MSKIYKLLFTVSLTLGIGSSIFAQNAFFADAGENASLPTTGQKVLNPQKYRAAILDTRAMKNFLWALPSENNVMNRAVAPVMELPMPNGKMAKFRVWESSLMEPALAARFPEMRTFAGQGVDDPYATIRFDYNPYFGFSAQVLSVNGNVYIDPYARRDVNQYISYYGNDNFRSAPFSCELLKNKILPDNPQAGPCRGTQLSTYRLALACTGEYAVAVAGPAPTVPAVAAAMLTSVNRVSGVYELELAVRMVLVANNNNLIYLNGATDPYSNNNGGAMLGQNQTTIDNIIGNANYDIGHVFSTGGGGVAFLGVICETGAKAGGVTGLTNPVGDNYDIDYVAHEMGHQFGGNHTFNSTTSNCGGGNRNGSTAYEVGSGTTIQAYAGICGTDNIQPHSDPFFHPISYDEIANYISGAGATCAVQSVTGNILPVITAMNGNNMSIPLNTPFTLSASATDANGDPITYCWEEWDLGTAGAWNNGATSTSAPLFKSRIPKISGERTFPDLAVILANYPANPPAVMDGLKGETLPLVGRQMKFRMTVRDNRAGGGGIVSGGSGCQAGFTGVFQVSAIDGTGPFIVTAPNGGESFVSGLAQTITWNVAGTNASPINVSNVKITLSTDGGLTYPTVLAANTPNDGTESITMPCISTNTARIRIEALGNIFFDISNADFAIQSGFDFNSPSAVSSTCPVPNSLSVTLSTVTACGFSSPVTLSAGALPPGTSIGFSPNPVTPGNSSVITLSGTNTLAAGTYNIIITGTASGAVTKTRTISFIVNAVAPPSITTQPADQTVCASTATTLCVTATGSNTYQWESSPTCTGTWTAIPGATSACYTINNPTVTFSYRVQVTGSCGGIVTSNCATITVINPVVITTQPTNKEICSGSNTTFTVAATSSQAINYQWQVNTGAGFVNVPNAAPYTGGTSSTLTITNAPTTMSGYIYRVLLTNTSCTTPVTSNSATLTVRQLPTVTLAAAPLTSLLPGQTTTLTAVPSASTGGILTTAWFLNGTPFANAGNTYLVNVEKIGTYKVGIAETFASGLVCANSSADVVINATVSSRLFIFPSPNDGNFTVSYYNNGGTSTQRKISVFNSGGQMVFNKVFPIAGPYTLIPINLQSASRGIYYVVVGDASGNKLADGKVHVR